MTRMQFQSEKDYLAARDIAVSLRKRGLLTDEEFGQIDTILRQKFAPVFSVILAENPCYVPEDAA